jgi:hypothetical protein
MPPNAAIPVTHSPTCDVIRIGLTVVYQGALGAWIR